MGNSVYGTAKPCAPWKKHLTLSTKCAIMYMKRGRKTSQTRKANAMKKASLESLVRYLDGEAITDLDTIKAEIEAELAKGKAKADANRELYSEYHDKVIEAIRLANAPVSAQDIADATGIARGKVVHGLTKLWTAEVVVDKSGKANTYTLA